MSNMTPAAYLEYQELLSAATELTKRGSTAEIAQARILRTKAEGIERRGLSTKEGMERYTAGLQESLATPSTATTSDPQYRAAFHRYVYDGALGMPEVQKRTLEVGTQSITWSAGPSGGYLVPVETEQQIFESMNQVDDLLSPDACTFTVEPNAPPRVLVAYDLSTIEASLVGEAVQQQPQAFPEILGRTLRSNIILKASFAATIEALSDVPDVLAKLSRAFGVALGRAASSLCVTGNGGTSEPQGLTTAIAPSYATGSGVITLSDILAIYYSVNRYYRQSKQCNWYVSDSVFERLRAAKDDNGRPLMNVERDGEVLLGKPIRVCPSLGVVGGSLNLNSTLMFGDGSSFHIRTSKPRLLRSINSSIAGIEYGEALYTAYLRLDSAYMDASGGTSPALTAATITA